MKQPTSYPIFLFPVIKVLNSGTSGQQLDISMYMRDPNNKHIKYDVRKTEGKMLGYQVSVAGDYQICFNNRYALDIGHSTK